MARAPTRVGMTSGQGVSRRSYQTGYALGNRGGAAAGGGVKPLRLLPGSSGSSQSSSRTYSKSKVDNGGSMNIAYSDREFKNPSIKNLTDAPAPRGKNAPKGFTI